MRQAEKTKNGAGQLQSGAAGLLSRHHRFYPEEKLWIDRNDTTRGELYRRQHTQNSGKTKNLMGELHQEANNILRFLVEAETLCLPVYLT